MGVYIKGMEMPTSEQWVRTVNIYSDGVVTNYGEDAEATIATAVHVPQHGDLIDREVLRAEVKKHATPSDAWVFSFIRTAPTVIPADDKDINVPNREEGL